MADFILDDLRESIAELKSIESLSASMGRTNDAQEDISSLTEYVGATFDSDVTDDVLADPKEARDAAFKMSQSRMQDPITHLIHDSIRIRKAEKQGLLLGERIKDLSQQRLLPGASQDVTIVLNDVNNIRSKFAEANKEGKSLFDVMYDDVDFGKVSTVNKLLFEKQSRAFELALSGHPDEEIESTITEEFRSTYGDEVASLLETDPVDFTEHQQNLVNLLGMSPDQMLEQMRIDVARDNERAALAALPTGKIFQPLPEEELKKLQGDVGVLFELGLGVGLLGFGALGVAIDTAVGLVQAGTGNDIFQSLFTGEEVELSTGTRTFIGLLSAIPAISPVVKHGGKLPKVLVDATKESIGNSAAYKLAFGSKEEATQIITKLKENLDIGKDNVFNELMIQVKNQEVKPGFTSSDFEIAEIAKAVDKGDVGRIDDLIARGSEPDSIINKTARLAAAGGDRESQRFLHLLVGDALTRPNIDITGKAIVNPGQESAIRALSRTDPDLAEKIIRDNRIYGSLGGIKTWNQRILGKDGVFIDSANRAFDDPVIQRLHALIEDADAHVTQFRNAAKKEEIIDFDNLVDGDVAQIEWTPRKQIEFKPQQLLEHQSIVFGADPTRSKAIALGHIPQSVNIGARLKHANGSDMIIVDKDEINGLLKVMDANGFEFLLTYTKDLTIVKETPKGTRILPPPITKKHEAAKIARRKKKKQVRKKIKAERAEVTDAQLWQDFTSKPGTRPIGE